MIRRSRVSTALTSAASATGSDDLRCHRSNGLTRETQAIILLPNRVASADPIAVVSEMLVERPKSIVVTDTRAVVRDDEYLKPLRIGPRIPVTTTKRSCRGSSTRLYSAGVIARTGERLTGIDATI